MNYDLSDTRVEYVSHMGDDLTVVNAARVSLNKEVDHMRLVDRALLRFLAENGHWSPFAHPQITLRMHAPIFVARQLMRHKEGLHINEMSRRYTEGEVELFEPEEWRARPQTRMGAVRTPTTYSTGVIADDAMRTAYNAAVHAYNAMLDAGVAPEQARMVLPQALMTTWYWTGSLAAFARVYKLRSDPAAQAETAEAAELIRQVIEPLFPLSWPLIAGSTS